MSVLQAELLIGCPVNNVEEARQAAQELLKRGCGAVVITLGPQGCVVLKAQEKTSTHVPANAVTAVDTTVRMTHTQLCFYYFSLSLSQHNHPFKFLVRYILYL